LSPKARLMVLNEINQPCGLKSAASAELRVSTLRGERKYLKTISLAAVPA
jgi:hypothetical protein